MEPGGPLPQAQQPATCPYPEPDQSNQCPIPLLKIHFDNIPRLQLGLPSGLLSSGFPTKTLYTPLLPPIRAACSAHFILDDLITRIIFGEYYRTLSSSLCSVHSPVTSFPSDPNILLSILFSNTLILFSSLNVSDQVSHPYTTIRKN